MANIKDGIGERSEIMSSKLNIQKIDVSIIIVWNDLNKLNEAKSYIEAQTFKKVELIALDNRGQVFSSAAQALNYGAQKAIGSILIFMHQDVYLWDLEAIQKIYDSLSHNPKLIVGAAGVSKSDNKVHYEIVESKELKIKRGLSVSQKNSEAITLDECLIAISKERWNQLRFDEKTCSDWHLYSVDICYCNILNGGGNRILPLYVCHDSLGNSTGAGFKLTLKKLVKKYQGKIKRIEAPCCHLACNKIGFMWFFLRRRLVKIKKRILG